MDRKEFNRKLSGLINAEKSQRDKVQVLLVAGLVHYADHADTGYLTDLVRALRNVQTKKAKVVSAYIQEFANVGWGKLKDKKLGFKKLPNEEVHVQMPDVTWYDWEGGKDADQPEQTYDGLATIKATVTKMIKKAQEGKLKEGQEDYIIKLQKALDDK